MADVLFGAIMQADESGTATAAAAEPHRQSPGPLVSILMGINCVNSLSAGVLSLLTVFGLGQPRDATNRSSAMIERETGPANPAALADEIGPVRSWLTRYFGRRIRDYAEVEDMVQDVFARMVARDNPEPIENLGGYILKTAVSVLADRARLRSSRGVGLHVAFDSELHGEEEIHPERVLVGREDLHAATASLLGLPERTRTVFILRRLEGQRYRDIARHLGISVSAVEKHMVRAIQHLSLAMEQQHGS